MAQKHPGTVLEGKAPPIAVYESFIALQVPTESYLGKRNTLHHQLCCFLQLRVTRVFGYYSGKEKMNHSLEPGKGQ